MRAHEPAPVIDERQPLASAVERKPIGSPVVYDRLLAVVDPGLDHLGVQAAKVLLVAIVYLYGAGAEGGKQPSRMGARGPVHGVADDERRRFRDGLAVGKGGDALEERGDDVDALGLAPPGWGLGHDEGLEHVGIRRRGGRAVGHPDPCAHVVRRPIARGEHDAAERRRVAAHRLGEGGHGAVGIRDQRTDPVGRDDLAHLGGKGNGEGARVVAHVHGGPRPALVGKPSQRIGYAKQVLVGRAVLEARDPRVAREVDDAHDGQTSKHERGLAGRRASCEAVIANWAC